MAILLLLSKTPLYYIDSLSNFWSVYIVQFLNPQPRLIIKLDLSLTTESRSLHVIHVGAYFLYIGQTFSFLFELKEIFLGSYLIEYCYYLT